MEAKCVREEALMDFLEGRLSDRQRRRVESHLASCDSCLEDMLVVRSLIREPALADTADVPAGVTARAIKAVQALRKGSLVERVRGAVAPVASRWSQVVEDLVSSGEPGLAPVRGSREDLDEDLILLSKAFSELDVDIEMERKGLKRASIKVRLTRVDHPGRPVRVTLLSGEKEISSMILVEHPVLFENIPLGRYLLAFSRGGRRVGEYAFQIREKRDDGE